MTKKCLAKTVWQFVFLMALILGGEEICFGQTSSITFYGNESINGSLTVNGNIYASGATTALGATTVNSLYTSGTATLGATTATSINGAIIGNSSPSTGSFTTLDATGNATFVTSTHTSLNASTSLTLGGIAVMPLHHNKYLIDGSFDIAQTGTTSSLTTAPEYGALDAWWGVQTSSATGGVLNQDTGNVLPGFKHSAKLGRSTGSNTNPLKMGQIIESIDAVKLQGKTVTLSFYAKAGANFSASSSILNSSIVTGTGTDQGRSVSWTGESSNDQNNTLTTAFKRFSHTITIPANTNEVAVLFSYVPTGTAGADDYVYITGVQLDEGALASPYFSSSYGEELFKHQRYFKVIKGGIGIAGTTSSVQLSISLFPEMRISPSVTTPSGNMTISDTYSNFTQSSAQASIIEYSPSAMRIQLGNFSSLVVRQSYMIGGYTNYFTLNARL